MGEKIGTLYVTDLNAKGGIRETDCFWRGGGLAVTRSLRGMNPGFVVTHQNTGARIAPEHHDCGRVVEMAEALAAAFPWHTLCLDDMARFESVKPQWLRDVVAVIRAIHSRPDDVAPH